MVNVKHITSTFFLKHIPLVGFMLLATGSFAQQTIVRGRILDANTQQGVPYANIQFVGTSVGTISDINGDYKLETDLNVDSLQISYLGYLPQSIAIARHVKQQVNVRLIKSNVQLNEIKIIAGPNPALAIIKKMVENKKENDKSRLDYYEYEVYNKIEFDMYNLPQKLMNRKIMSPFKFMMSSMDTIDGKSYLPFFLIESLSEVYYQKNPEIKREIIKGTKISGAKNESVVKFMGDMYQHFNIYDNYIYLFNKNFISPAANNGTFYYKYYLTDSTYLGNFWCYKIRYVAKRKQELTFEGHMWIADSTWAIKKSNLKISEGANINYVNDVVIEQEYVLIDHKGWMLARDNIKVDFNVTKKAKRMIGFIGQKSTFYTNIKVNQRRADEFYKIGENIVVEEGS
ncbi:MAG: carboxypeptidase-like regulatory domain-containing protein, partial [Bacteroidetes bacterium]|nr:carboxypeptidase-like regulatory domain-containing protein [Bacteroidota bacterium]